MEFIANLERSQTAKGLTPENLETLEKIFQNAVGDKKEIDIQSFKKVTQSKNMFFVERIFNVFDADKSGTVSLEEFMRVMRCFAKQSPAEKLRYLFDVYDINNDGYIEFNELRSVISECMKENGLQFGEEETDELTRMLFEDADTDGSGTITFTEFKNQLERQPAFMENLTLSIERWLLPPMKTKSRSKSSTSLFSCRKIRWRHIRNNWTSVVYLLLYFLINILLFTTRAYEYREDNTFVILARACGQCLNFNCAFIVMLVLRQSLTWLRTHGFAQYFPIDQHLYYHKLTGIVILIFSVWHTAMHVSNFNILTEQSNKTLPEFLTSTHLGIGWVGGAACLTGWILLLILIVMCISAMPFVRRSGKFEIFYYLHLLYFVFWTCLILHGPHFWKWFLGPAVLFLIELIVRISRNLSSSKVAYVQQGVLLPSKVTHLVIKRPPKFDYRPGDYVYINIPTIANFEWHPFTISSAPELDDVIWLHIRGVGEWTNSLYSYFQREDREAVLSDELVKNLSDPANSLKNESLVSRGFIYHSSCTETPPGLDIPKNCSLLSARIMDKDDISVSEKHSSKGSEIRLELNDSSFLNPTFYPDNLNQSVIEMGKDDNTFKYSNNGSNESITGKDTTSPPHWQRTSFTSFSTSRAIQQKNKEDIRSMLAEHSRHPTGEELFSSDSRLSVKSRRPPKGRRKSVRVSMAKQGLRRCQTVIVMPTVSEDDEEEVKTELEKDAQAMEAEVEDLKREVEVENVVVSQKPLRVFLDGPYGSPTRHIFQVRHAVLIATGIGVTPFASILQSVMYHYRKSKHTCPNCSHKWSDPMPVSNVHLKKVDFFWLNRNQRCFEWFVNLLSELEVEQAQLKEKDRFLDIHMYITSALHRNDMKAVGLQMALDLLYKKEKRDLITGLKSRTQPGRPDWNKVFTSIAEQRKGKVTVFFCGPNQLAKTLQAKCDEFGFRFRKEIF
ncbi:NADPH oxidase 5-like [Argiope bruennichi]|uniref:NADPH oxidase 5-like n=1 Tax=Argiope bruennichi TaxID=94029 RepID=UPI002493FAA2|nr:NADPH oxidase 5-like [Argiope bruennichi]